MSESALAQSQRLAARMQLMQPSAASLATRSTLLSQLDAHEIAHDDDASSRVQARRNTIDAVQRRCTALYAQLGQLQSAVHAQQKETQQQQRRQAASNSAPLPLRIRALEAKRTAYRVELALLEQSSAQVTRDDGPLADDALAAESVVRDVVQLEETVAALQGELSERLAVLADAEQSNGELQAVYDALKRRIDANADASAHRHAVDVSEGAALAWHERLEQRRAELDASLKSLRQTLALFIRHGYPDLEAADPATGLPRVHSLRTLVNALVEGYLGDNPYVLTEHAWPPYVELLLRAHVAELHPDDKRFMRLVDFLARD